LKRSASWLKAAPSLGGKLYTPYLAVVMLLTVVMCVVLYAQTHDAVNQNMTAAMSANLSQVAMQIEQQMDGMALMSEIIWINPHFQAMQPGVDDDKVKNHKDILTYYKLLDAFGDMRKVNKSYTPRIYMNDNVIFAAEHKLFFPVSEIEGQEWFGDLQKTSGKILWCLLREGEGKPVLSIARSSFWKDSMGKRAVVYVGFRTEYLDSLLSNPFVAGGGHTLLMTRSGEILSGGPGSPALDSPLPEDLLRRMLSGAPTAALGGQAYLMVRRPLGRPGLELISMVPPVSAWDALRQGFPATVTVLSLFLMLLVGVAVLFAGRFRRRINNLVRHIETIEGDGFRKRIDVTDGGEIAIIERKFNEMSLRLSNMMDEIDESNRRKREAELNALQSQMNPHFLHNTLDAINWMAIDARQYEIAETVATLGDFFRTVLSGGKNIITVEEELKLTEQYVRIQQLRNRDNLDIVFDVSPECLPYACVKLLIQPLIENAIKHSNTASDVMRILVEMELTGSGYLQLSVLDNGIGIAASAELPEARRTYRSGYGLKSVEQRLMLHFGEDIMMNLGDGLDGRGTCVTLRWRAVLPGARGES